MIEIKGNLWDYINSAIICITTNGYVKKNGECVMGKGCALECKQRFPDIPFKLGNLIKTYGNKVFYLDNHIVSFPVKHNWFEKADLILIEKSCKELVELINLNENVKKVILPRPGVGNGKLSYSDVKPILEKYLDDRFYIISKEDEL